MYFLAWHSVFQAMFVAHLSAFVKSVPAQYSIDWKYVLPRGCASILGLDTLVCLWALWPGDVSIGHMVYVLHAVLHILCVVVLHLVLIGVHNILCLWPKSTFGYRPRFADVFMASMLYICTQCTVVRHRLTGSAHSVWICLWVMCRIQCILPRHICYLYTAFLQYPIWHYSGMSVIWTSVIRTRRSTEQPSY